MQDNVLELLQDMVPDAKTTQHIPRQVKDLCVQLARLRIPEIKKLRTDQQTVLSAVKDETETEFATLTAAELAALSLENLAGHLTDLLCLRDTNLELFSIAPSTASEYSEKAEGETFPTVMQKGQDAANYMSLLSTKKGRKKQT